MKEDYIADYKKLGLNINYYRRSKGYSQMELAELADVEFSHISRVELSKSAASLDLIFAIAKALEIPVQKLFEFRE